MVTSEHTHVGLAVNVDVAVLGLDLEIVELDVLAVDLGNAMRLFNLQAASFARREVLKVDAHHIAAVVEVSCAKVEVLHFYAVHVKALARLGASHGIGGIGICQANAVAPHSPGNSVGE